MIEINIISLNEGKPNTCGSCKHTDNDLGFVALHCQLLYDLIPEEGEVDSSDKVRSWEVCCFHPSKWEPRTSAPSTKGDEE